MEDLPRYFIVGARPVMVIATEGGGVRVLAYDWMTGDMARNGDYVARVYFPDVEVDEVTKEEFDAEVERLRNREE